MRPHIGAALLLFAASACGGIDHFEHVMVDEATVPGSSMINGPFSVQYGGDFNGVDLSKSESFSNNGVDPNDVDAIFVKAVRLEGTRPDVDRLNVILNSVVIWVQAPDLPRVVVASSYNFPNSNQASIEVVAAEDGESINLKPYATAASMTVGTDINLKVQPAFDTTLRTTITLLVDINLPGL